MIDFTFLFSPFGFSRNQESPRPISNRQPLGHLAPASSLPPGAFIPEYSPRCNRDEMPTPRMLWDPLMGSPPRLSPPILYSPPFPSDTPPTLVHPSPLLVGKVIFTDSPNVGTPPDPLPKFTSAPPKKVMQFRQSVTVGAWLMLSSDSEKGVLRSNSPGDSEKGVLRSNSPSRKRALGDGEGDITNKRRRLGKSSVDFTTPQPSDGSGVVISSTPSPVSMPVSKAIPEGISKVDSNITRSRDATPELIRGVDDLFKEHKIQFPEGVSTQIFNLLHFENTMRRYNPESVGGQLSEKQVRDLFEALNQLDSLIGPDGDIRAIQDAKNILCEYVSRCVFRKVSENPANVSVISTILDQYLPQSEETFLKNQMHGLVLNYVESYLFEMANSHEGDRKVLSLAIGLLDSSGQHPSTYFSRLTGKMLGHLSFSNMSDDIFLTANQMLTDKLANVSSPLNQHAIWFRDKMKGMFLEEFVRRLELGLDESYFFRKPYVSNGDEGIKLAIALVGVSTQKPSAGLYRWTNLVVTNMPNILSKMSDDIFLTANQMLTDKLANVSSPLDQDAIWFRNKMEGMFLEEFQRRRVIKNLPRIK